MSSELLTLSAAAEFLGCHDRTVRRYVATGRLPAYRIGPRQIRLKASDLEALVQPIPTTGGDRVAG